MSFTRVIAVARKETLQILRDPRFLFLAFAFPVVLIFLFGYAITLDVREIPTVILDRSNSTHSRQLIRSFVNSGYFSEIARANSEKEITELIDRGVAAFALIIPSDFAEQLQRDEAPVLTIADGSDANTSQSIVAYSRRILADYNFKRVGSAIGIDVSKMRVTAQTRFWYNQELDSRHFLVPGLIALIMTTLGALLTSLTIAREWERGTMELLISTPIKPAELALGKLLPFYVIGMFDLFLSSTVAVIIFDVPFRGSLALLTISSSLFLAAVLSMGYMISVVTRSQQLAYQVSMLTSFLPGLLLSGFLFPISSMPKVIQIISLAVPGRYLIEILRGIFLRGAGLDLLLPNLLALAGFAALFAILTVLTFRRRV